MNVIEHTKDETVECAILISVEAVGRAPIQWRPVGFCTGKCPSNLSSINERH